MAKKKGSLTKFGRALRAGASKFRAKGPKTPLVYNIRPAPRVYARRLVTIHGTTYRPLEKALEAEDWINMGGWVGVQSSNVAAIRYDKGTSTLHMRFTSGRYYYYEKVPQADAADCFNASSIGAFEHRRLRRVFSTVRVRGAIS